MFLSGEYLITIHRDPLPRWMTQREASKGRVLHSEQFAPYRVLAALADSFFPLLCRYGRGNRRPRSAGTRNPNEGQLSRLNSLRHQLVACARSSPPSATCSPARSTRLPSFLGSRSTSATQSTVEGATNPATPPLLR